ncbi:MAG: DUF169 domain-containing protein [Deltaproteobacteria bacterium]|nr:DUF169 domain-containing protein [Deltaproteobacteria bacterium]
MEYNNNDLDVFERFNFVSPPIGVKFSPKLPGTMDRLEGNLALCEMLKRAQEGMAFYADCENHACSAGAYVLGQKDIQERYLNGEFGAALKIFHSPRAAGRVYHYIPKIAKGVVKYTLFAPLHKFEYDPDVLICLSRPDQTEILLRALSYRTGTMWSSRYSAVIGCAWIFVYPYLSGELNYSATGLGHGMKRRKLFPEGYQLVAIPFDQLPSIVRALREMPWDLPAYQPDGFKFVQGVISELGLE